MARLNWNSILEEIDNALEFFKKEGVKPTLRTLFYNLVSKNLIPNTRSSYQTLSKQLVEARKEGRYDWNFLEDKTRVVLGFLDDEKFDDNVVEDLKDRLEKKLEDLDIEKMLDEYFDYMIPYLRVGYWAEQKTAVEIWIEKEALASTIENWTYSLRVPIRVNKGYSSWTFIYNNVQDLNKTLKKHENIVILYLGDLDPSGLDIQRFLEETIEYFGMDATKVELKRLAITPEQVEHYNLPPKPEDAETLEKLARDPRAKTYTGQYVVELDSLVAYVPSEFRKELIKTIEQFRDLEVYKNLEIKKKELERKCNNLLLDAKKQARKKIIELLNELEEEEKEEEEEEKEDDDWF